MSRSILPKPTPESFNPIEIANDETEELAVREQLMLDREDYYQLAADY
jgi:hypothetical protein